jgi:hypothetical protein
MAQLKKAFIVLRVNDNQRAAQLLSEAGIALTQHREIF